MNCHVFVDFDGTIVTEDTTDLLLERFADPSWHAIEAQWRAGLIGSRECMVRQVDLLRASPEQIEDTLRDVQVDPEFAAFVGVCTELGFPVTVVSDGLDLNVHTVLSRAGLALPYYANRMEWLGGDRWRLSFPHASSACNVLSGNCKCKVTEQVQDKVRIMIGDGRSDFCVAGRVDLVLCKGSLTAHCVGAQLPHLPFEDFGEAKGLLLSWAAKLPSVPTVVATHQGEK